MVSIQSRFGRHDIGNLTTAHGLEFVISVENTLGSYKMGSSSPLCGATRFLPHRLGRVGSLLDAAACSTLPLESQSAAIIYALAWRHYRPPPRKCSGCIRHLGPKLPHVVAGSRPGHTTGRCPLCPHHRPRSRITSHRNRRRNLLKATSSSPVTECHAYRSEKAWSLTRSIRRGCSKQHPRHPRFQPPSQWVRFPTGDRLKA